MVAGLSISQVARELGLRPSAIRYYEEIGVLPPAGRVNGRRRYEETVLYRLALVQRARSTGFSLDEIRELFFGFAAETPVSRRWKKLGARKLHELAAQIAEMQEMQTALRRLLRRCACDGVEQCGRGILLGATNRTSCDGRRAPRPRRRTDRRPP